MASKKRTNNHNDNDNNDDNNKLINQILNQSLQFFYENQNQLLKQGQ